MTPILVEMDARAIRAEHTSKLTIGIRDISDAIPSLIVIDGKDYQLVEVPVEELVATEEMTEDELKGVRAFRMKGDVK